MDNKPIVFTEETELIQGNKYIIEEIEIIFTYDPNGNREKPYILESNHYRIDHLPTKADKRTYNLKSMSERPKEEQKAIQSKGGIKSAEVQNNRRTFKESMSFILGCKASKEEIDSLPIELQELFKKNGYIPTKEDLINIRAVELAIVGSDKHMIFSRDTVGEKPTDKTEVTADIITDGERALLEKISNRILQDRM